MNKYVVVVVLALPIFLAAVTCSAVQYHVSDLGWIGSGYSEISAFAIADSGMIIGSGVHSQDGQTYVVWDEHGTITALQVVGIYSAASDINSSGTIVGSANMSNNNPYAVVWNATGAVASIIGPGFAVGVNESGQILQNDQSGYLVSNLDGTSYRLADILGYRYSVASTLSNNGYVAGYGMDMNYRQHPIIWDTQGNGNLMSDVPGSLYAQVYSMNDAGKVVGYATNYTWTSAVVWDVSGSPLLLPNFDGYGASVAWGINNVGLVVGYSYSTLSKPVIWNEDGNVSALPLLQGGSSGAAYAINNNGLIVGYSYGADNHMHAVLWEPVPEPASLVALCAGLIPLAFRRRRG